jgi:hypothetical protein
MHAIDAPGDVLLVVGAAFSDDFGDPLGLVG